MAGPARFETDGRAVRQLQGRQSLCECAQRRAQTWRDSRSAQALIRGRTPPLPPAVCGRPPPYEGLLVSELRNLRRHITTITLAYVGALAGAGVRASDLSAMNWSTPLSRESALDAASWAARPFLISGCK